MNILFVTQIPVTPNKGGIGRVSGMLAHEFEKQAKAKTFYLALLREDEEIADPERQLFLPEKSLSSPQNQKFYDRLIAEKQIDIVIVQCATKLFPFKKADNHPPLIFVLHNDPCEYAIQVKDKYAEKLERKNGLTKFIYEKLIIPAKIFMRRKNAARRDRHNYALADKYVLLSPGFKSGFLSHFPTGTDENKLTAIPNPGPSVDCPNTLPRKKSLLYVRRLSRIQKRPDLIVKIWAKLEKDFPDWELNILGDGPDADGVKKLAQQLGLSRCKFHGFRRPDEFYRDAYALCMTSTNESFGMVLVEASAHGCIPVAFNSFPAAEEIIQDGENGFLVRPFDLDEYADKLRKLMNASPQAFSGLSANAVQNAKRFSLEKITNQWIALFEELKRTSG